MTAYTASLLRKGEARGREEGKAETVYELVSEGLITPEKEQKS